MLAWSSPLDWYTLLQKKRNFSELIFPGDPGSLTLTPGCVHFTLLPRALAKCNTLQSSSIYTLHSTFHAAFLLKLSVHVIYKLTVQFIL